MQPLPPALGALQPRPSALPVTVMPLTPGIFERLGYDLSRWQRHRALKPLRAGGVDPVTFLPVGTGRVHSSSPAVLVGLITTASRLATLAMLILYTSMQHHAKVYKGIYSQ
eukprot:6031395-Pleurochrysis_carterae.AAC.1